MLIHLMPFIQSMTNMLLMQRQHHIFIFYHPKFFRMLLEECHLRLFTQPSIWIPHCKNVYTFTVVLHWFRMDISRCVKFDQTYDVYFMQSNQWSFCCCCIMHICIYQNVKSISNKQTAMLIIASWVVVGDKNALKI